MISDVFAKLGANKQGVRERTLTLVKNKGSIDVQSQDTDQ